MNKKVSILMPAYNCEEYIQESIKSILEQTYSNIELIIVNDGSTDSTLDKIKEFPNKNIKVYNNDGNKGLPYTRNYALSLADGDYVAIMDADDIAHKKRIQTQVEFLEKNKNISVVGSNVIEFNGTFKKRFRMFEQDPEEVKILLMFRNCIANSAAMFRRDFVKEYNINYRKDYFAVQDYRFWIDCCKYGQISNINKFLIKYRVGHANITQTSKKKKNEARKNLLNEIHFDVLKQNGFDLSEEDLNTYNTVLYDNPQYGIQEMKKFKEVLRNLLLYNESKNIFDKSKFYKIVQQVWDERVIQADIKKTEKFNLILTKRFIGSNYKVCISLLKSLLKK